MEEIYHYYWKHRLPFGTPLRLVDGRPLVVRYPGLSNSDAGPDFLRAKVEIDGVAECGKVELHVRASDWHRHHHDGDPAYADVVLHVVADDDARILRPDGSEIPQYAMVLPEAFLEAYRMLSNPYLGDVKCREHLHLLPRLLVADWLDSLSMERLQRKASQLADIYRESGHDWRQTLFAALARALGFGVNSEPMQAVGLALPLNYAGRHADNPMQTQALVFGVAGMLDPSLHRDNRFYQELCREYAFLALKYRLQPVSGVEWKYGRTRPQNFPHRRLATLAAALFHGFPLFNELLASPEADPKALRSLFAWRVDNYWNRYFSFSPSQATLYEGLSDSSIDLVLINAAVPFLYAYGILRGDAAVEQRALKIMENLKAERNRITMRWSEWGVPVETAFNSQAVIQLQREYCERDRCLDCRFANHLLRLTTGAVPPSQLLR